MQRLDILIREARERSGNQRYSATQGIAQRSFVSYANDAQQRLYNRITQEHSSLFNKEGFLDTVARVAHYTLPTDIYLKHNIIKVDYALNGNPLLYNPLELRTPRQEITAPGYPTSYFLRDGEIILSPLPISGATNALRLNYQYTIPTLDVRRALIDTITDDGGGAFTITLTAPSGQLLTTEMVEDLTDGWVEAFSIVTASGVVAATDITFVSYDSTTYEISCTSAAAIDSLTGYLLFGANATTHGVLPAVCERFIVEYMVLRAQMRESNGEAAETSPILQAIEKEILDAIAELEEDLTAIPILDYSMLNYSEDL